MIRLENHPSDVANNLYLENLPRRLRGTHLNDFHSSALRVCAVEMYPIEKASTE